MLGFMACELPCLCDHMHVFIGLHGGQRTTLKNWVYSSIVGSRNKTQVVRLALQELEPLRHLVQASTPSF